MKKILFFLLVFISYGELTPAQSDPFNAIGSNETGTKPFGSYDGSKFDQVDLATGGLNLTLDIASLTARGHKSTYGWRYSSKFWMATSSLNAGQIVTTWTVENTSLGESHTSVVFPVNAGWRDTRARFTYINSQVECLVNGLPKTYTGIQTGYTYVDENGAKHSFPNWKWQVAGIPPSNCGLTISGYSTGYSNEGALRLSASGISFPSGGGSSAQGVVEDKWAITNTAPNYSDSNGNTWSVLTAANGQTFVQLVLDATPRLSSIQVLNQSGSWGSWGITNTTAANSGSPQTGALSVPGTMTMPNGKSFGFTYGGDWGELTQVTLPTGGYIRYEYTTIANGATSGNQGQPIPGRYVTKRAVSPGGTAGSEQVTTYGYVVNTSTGNNLTTTVTRPDGSYEVHYFDISWRKPTKELWVESHAAGGALLRRHDNTWTCDIAPITSDSDASDFDNFELPASGQANCRITQVLTTLDDGKKRQVTTTYDTFSFTGDDGQPVTESHGNIKKIEETDFGTSGPGPVVRVTKFKYLHEQNTAYAGSSAYIVNRAAAKWVGTPTNTYLLAETQYDTTTPTGFHGNPSVTQSALLQANAPNPDDPPPDSSVSSWRATSHSYDSFGNQTSTTDPGGHTTTFEYSQCTSGNLSATNYAITGFREEKTWNCSIGAPLTSKDLNLQITAFEYSDPMFRLTKVNKPDTGYVTLAYNDTTLVVTATELVNNGVATTLSAQHNFDGLGRLTESSILGDPCGAIKSDTIYDSVGRISQVSNPYCLQSESTYGLTTYQYDGLDRKNLLIPPDGTVSSDNVSTVFTGNCALVTDQAGKLRKSCSDALGRVIEVDEPNGVLGPATSGTGSLTVSGTEQSTQSTSPGTPGTATVSISGTEQSGTFTNPTGDCAPRIRCYDDGSVTITVNGQAVSAFYGQGDTASSVAGALAAVVNSSSSYATATASGTVVTLTARTAGAGTNYTLAVATGWDSDFTHASFTPTKSGATLTGGTNGTTTTVYDSGTVSVTVSSIAATINYSQTVNNTAALVTSALASAINGNSSYPVSASASGTTLTLTAKQTGAATNYTVSSASTTTQGTYFAHPSFSATSTTLTGGSDASGGLATPWVTLYSYDVLNNLTCVVQKGTDATAFTNCASALSTWRPRSATYNSLSQLVSSTNPETGTLNYTYDPDGNVLTRIAPTPNQSGTLTVTTTYSYDAMHRLTGKIYSNGEPSVTYSYDQTNCLGLAACYNKGHRTGMTDAAGSESWAYDLMGRAVKEQRVTNGVTKTTTYTYYMDGSVASIIYPSGRTITYGYDAVTRPVSAADSANSINYVTAALYSPAGGLASLQNGAALISKFFYNKRLQPCRISVKNTGTSPSQCSDAVNLGNILDFTYDYNLGAADNGEVKQIANNRNTSRTQNFTYDSLNRILTASSQATTGTYAWGLQFGYDIWGNLLTSSLTQGSAPILTVSADTNNRISGFCYDAAGNLLAQSVPPCPSPTYTYDAENRIKTTAGVTYTYDGDGNRVQKSNGKLYWYGSGSVILDESDATGNVTNEYIFFGSKRLARRVVSSGQIQYFFADHLGSSRVVTDASGNILDDADFYPFGGERTYTSTSGNAYKFTGKERDTESGLDDFGARYFTSQFGRFMTPDWSASPVLVPYADLGNPQTFNLYSYVANNPINTVDPEGHFRLDPPGSFIYHDPDTGKPLYGDATSLEELLAQSEAQTPSTQQHNQKKQKSKPKHKPKQKPQPHLVLSFGGVRHEGLFYVASYQLYMVTGDTAVNISNDTSAPVPQVHEKEKVDQTYWQGGENKLHGKFEDMIQPKPDRNLYQYFTVGDNVVPVSFGRDDSNHIMETPEVKVTISAQVPGGIKYEPYAGP